MVAEEEVREWGLWRERLVATDGDEDRRKGGNRDNTLRLEKATIIKHATRPARKEKKRRAVSKKGMNGVH
jgi:hypothetical protein